MAGYGVLVLRYGNHYFRGFATSGRPTALVLVEDPDDASTFGDECAIADFVRRLDPDRRRSFLQADMTPMGVLRPVPADVMEG